MHKKREQVKVQLVVRFRTRKWEPETLGSSIHCEWKTMVELMVVRTRMEVAVVVVVMVVVQGLGALVTGSLGEPLSKDWHSFEVT